MTTGHLRANKRAELRTESSPRNPESAIQRRANAVLDAQVAKDADRARRFLDAQPDSTRPMTEVA